MAFHGNRQVTDIIMTLTTDRQMTYIDSAIVGDISLREFLKEVYRYRDDSRLRHHVEKNKEWARMTASCIVSVTKKDLRINVIQKFLEVAQHLLSLKNFNGIFGIVTGTIYVYLY
jgi:hypothetical protein